MATVCSGCGRKPPKTIRRSVTPGMLGFLKEIDRLGGGRRRSWVHVSEALPRTLKSRMEPKFKYFGLLEHDGAKGSGLWRLTQNGRLFLAGRYSIPRAVWVKNNTVVDATDERVTVRQIGAR
jgi:hypothetical protein